MTVSANDICANKKRMQKVKIASDQNQSTKKKRSPFTFEQ